MLHDQTIPTVFCYGDSEQSVTPDLLHCEALSLRSKKHQFKIKPHRHHNLCQFFYLISGHGIAYLDGIPMAVNAPCVINIAEMCVHHFDWSENVEGTVISISLPTLEILEKVLKQNQPMIRSTQSFPVHNNQDELESILNLLFIEYENTVQTARAYTLNSLVHLLGIWLERNAPSINSNLSQKDRASDYLKRFTQLVNQNFNRQLKLSTYASELGITEPYLNNICQQLLGKNAKQIVQQRVILEAKRHLIYTVQSISQIAYKLGFNDPAYFSRFFKRITRETPKDYRLNYSGKKNLED